MPYQRFEISLYIVGSFTGNHVSLRAAVRQMKVVDRSKRFKIGFNRFVTCGGGNTSMKKDGVMYVKGSGTALKDAGIDEILTEVQAQYDEWKAAKAQ